MTTIASASRDIDTLKSEIEMYRQIAAVNAGLYRDAESDIDTLRTENQRLRNQVAGFDHFHGDCGEVIYGLREDLAAAHKRLEELGEKP